MAGQTPARVGYGRPAYELRWSGERAGKDKAILEVIGGPNYQFWALSTWCHRSHAGAIGGDREETVDLLPPPPSFSGLQAPLQRRNPFPRSATSSPIRLQDVRSYPDNVL